MHPEPFKYAAKFRMKTWAMCNLWAPPYKHHARVSKPNTEIRRVYLFNVYEEKNENCSWSCSFVYVFVEWHLRSFFFLTFPVVCVAQYMWNVFQCEWMLVTAKTKNKTIWWAFLYCYTCSGDVMKSNSVREKNCYAPSLSIIPFEVYSMEVHLKSVYFILMFAWNRWKKSTIFSTKSLLYDVCVFLSAIVCSANGLRRRYKCHLFWFFCLWQLASISTGFDGPPKYTKTDLPIVQPLLSLLKPSPWQI